MATVAVVGGRQLTAPAGSSASLTRLPDLLPASLQHLEMLAIIGYGAYAQVAEVRSRRSGEHYALKVVEKQPLAARGMLQQLAREFGVQRGVRHPHTVQAVDLAEDASHAFLLLELCIGGSVWQATHKFPNSIVPESTAAQWLSDATVGCAHLHELGLVHRDVKLENLLIDEAGYVKLCDFGWCAFEADEPVGMCGTPQLAAPEVSNGEPQTAKVDAWALGACLVQMLKGRPLAGAQDAWLPRSASQNAKEVGSGFLTVDPSSRLGANMALDYPFVKACLRPEAVQASAETSQSRAEAPTREYEAESWAEPERQQSPVAPSPRVVRRISQPQEQPIAGKSLPAPTRLVSGPSPALKLTESSSSTSSLRRLYSQPPRQENRGTSPAPVLGGAAATQARLTQMTFKAPSKPKPFNKATPTELDSPERLKTAAAAAVGAAPDIIANIRANSAVKLNAGRKIPPLTGISKLSPSSSLSIASSEQAAEFKTQDNRRSPAEEVRRVSPTRHKAFSSEVKKLAQEALEATASLKPPDAGGLQAGSLSRSEEEAILRNFLNTPKPITSSASTEKALDTARRCIETARVLTERSLSRCASAQVDRVGASRAA